MFSIALSDVIIVKVLQIKSNILIVSFTYI